MISVTLYRFTLLKCQYYIAFCGVCQCANVTKYFVAVVVLLVEMYNTNKNGGDSCGCVLFGGRGGIIMPYDFFPFRSHCPPGVAELRAFAVALRSSLQPKAAPGNPKIPLLLRRISAPLSFSKTDSALLPQFCYGGGGVARGWVLITASAAQQKNGSPHGKPSFLYMKVFWKGVRGDFEKFPMGIFANWRLRQFCFPKKVPPRTLVLPVLSYSTLAKNSLVLGCWGLLKNSSGVPCSRM